MQIHSHSGQQGKVGYVRRRWIISCMSLSLIPIIIGIIILFFSRKEYTRQTLNNNEVLLTQVQSLIDQNFYDIRIIVENLSFSDELADFCSLIKETPQKRTYAKLQLKKQLADCVLKNSYIDSIYLYFWDTDEFITNTTSAEGKIIYSYYHQSEDLSYEEWLDTLKQKYSGNGMVLPVTGRKNTLAYMKSLPSTSLINTRLTIVTLIDLEKLTSMSSSITQKSGCYWNIMTNDSRFVLDSTPIMEEACAELEIPRDSANIHRIEAVNNNTLSILASGALDIVYWMQTPPGVYKEALRTINMIFSAGLLLILIGCVIFTAVFVSRNYSPIQQLLELVPQWDASGIAGQKDEYTAIMEAFESSQMASSRLAEQLSRQDALLTDTSLALMLKKTPRSARELETIERMKKVFPYPFVTLLVLRPGVDVPAFAPEDEQGMQLFLQQIGQNICSAENSGCFRLIKQDEYLILLLNTASDLSAFHQEHFQEITQQVNRWALENHKTPPLLAFSKSQEGLIGLSDCYEEAEYDLRYQLVFGVGMEKDSKESDRLRATENIYYSSEEESKLLGALLSGNLESSLELFRGIWENNTRHMGISKPYLFCLLYQVTGTLLRAANLLPDAAGMEWTLRETVRQLQQNESVERAYKAVEALLQEVCSLYDKEHTLATHRLKNDVLRYIDEHYDDVNLSVESLCSIFGKSRTYLFSLFKEDTGFSLMYHITRVRIENAKQLLQTTDMTIQDIAQKVGFNSAMSFTRAFKKYENIAPSKYREFNQKPPAKK